MKREKQPVSPLSREGHWPAWIPDAIWAPLVAGGLILIAGLIGLLAGQVWLFPSLAPTAFLQAENPELPASRFYNVVVGHLIGLGSGFCAVAVLNAWQAPSVLASHQLTPVRVWAAVIAVALTVLILLLL